MKFNQQMPILTDFVAETSGDRGEAEEGAGTAGAECYRSGARPNRPGTPLNTVLRCVTLNSLLQGYLCVSSLFRGWI